MDNVYECTHLVTDRVSHFIMSQQRCLNLIIQSRIGLQVTSKCHCFVLTLWNSVFDNVNSSNTVMTFRDLKSYLLTWLILVNGIFVHLVTTGNVNVHSF